MATYMVGLNEEARQQLSTRMTTGRAAAAKLLHARLLLKADVRDGRRCWTDAEIAAALDTSESTVHRVRQAFVEQGWEAALSRQRPAGRQYRKLDGAQEARLIA
jgi:transposase